MPLEIKDLTGLSQPLTKLVEVVSSAIGSTFRPHQIRREAEARAFETVTLARATAEATVAAHEIAFTAKRRAIEQIAQDYPEIAERAKQRLLTKEIEGQLNIESIAQIAAQELPEAVSDQPLDQDWRRKFFSDAENICESDMQILWGKVLAGELSRPGQFSLRTLDTLRQLSASEADLFARMCTLAMSTGWVALPGHDVNTALNPYGFTYNDLLALRDAGLLLDSDNLTKNFGEWQNGDPNQEEGHALLMNNGLQILLAWPGQARPAVRALILTNAGRELQSLIPHSLNEAYVRSLPLYFRAAGFTKIKRGVETKYEAGHTLISFETDL